MRSTLKPYFLDGFSKGLREKYTNTSSKNLPKQAKKMALRLDGVQSPLGFDKLRVTGYLSLYKNGRSKPLPYVRAV